MFYRDYSLEIRHDDVIILMFSLICALINDWVNNGEAGELRRHRAHYDVTIMEQSQVKPSAAYITL